MKNKIIFTFAAVLFLLTTAIYAQRAQYGFYDKYYTGILHNGIQEQNINFNGLNLSLWMHYLMQDISLGTTGLDRGWYDRVQTDLISSNITQYETGIRNVLADNNSHGYRTVAERPKISRLCYAHRSDYQAERKVLCDPYYDFYSFENSVHNNLFAEDIHDNSQWGEGQYVKHCYPTQTLQSGTPTLILQTVNANRDQISITNVCNGYMHNGWNTFIVKPRIRIPENVPGSDPEMDVCIIKVYDWNHHEIKSVTLKAKYFKDIQTGTYNGDYIENYNFGQDPINLKINDNPTGFNPFNPDYKSLVDDGCDVDYEVYWMNNCDMWIDYVRVDDEMADKLFKGEHDDWIQWEVENIAEQSGYNPLKFYIEEFFFANIPCIGYVNRMIKQLSGYKYSLMCDVNVGEYYIIQRRDFWSAPPLTVDMIKHTLIEPADLDEIYNFSYPFNGYKQGSPAPDSWLNTPFTEEVYVPETLPHSDYNESEGRFSLPASTEDYDYWLQTYLDRDDSYHFNDKMTGVYKFCDEISKECEIPFVNIVQTHLWYSQGLATTTPYIQREPTNEEMEMMANVSVTYGAKAQFWFWWGSDGAMTDNYFSRGLCEPPGPNHNLPRHDNVYGQYQGGAGSSKIGTVGRVNENLNKWSDVLMSFDNDNRHSYIYRDETERTALLSNSYFADVVTYIYGSGTPPCTNDAPPVTIPSGMRYECNEDRYLQVATFKKTVDDGNKYFMIVNRRCSPVQNDYNDGRRDVRVAFYYNSSYLPNFNIWNIVDVATNATVGTFNKMLYNNYVDLGWFNPGEGRLYKIVPTGIAGGTLTGDEYISGQSFTCEAPVYNNGYNITIGANTTIHFNDSSKFVMDGGVFTVGDQNTSGSQSITSDAVTGNTWHGHSFTNCEVNIYGATFSGLANDTTYAVNIIDCPVVDIRGCTFNTNNSFKGGINAVYFTNLNSYITNIYIEGNTFNCTGSTLPTVNVSSYAGVTTPLIIENNTFTEGNTAIFLSGVTGGAIKDNIITDNYIGINALTSQVDVSENEITSTLESGVGIFASGGSELKMNSSGSKELGGKNSISNEGAGTNNINVDGSYFLLDGGENIFNISDAVTSYHLYGYFPELTAGPFEETDNCFNISSSPVDPPYNMVTSGYQGSQITFNFTPYLSGCEFIHGGNYTVIDLGDGMYDTIYTGGSGSGGSEKEVAFELRSDIKRAYTPQLAKEKYDSVCVLMRYRNYSQAKTKCLDLINSYPDSIQSLNAVSKLFLATVASDTTYNAVNNLKIYYEELILNHSGNTSLVKRANYYILKCKVRMHEYSQALAGFQQIINQNPYSYEGLIARWDYMATSLLVQGEGGGESSIADWRLGNADLEDENLNQYLDDNPQSENRNPKSSGDKNPFTKEQRQDIRKSINTAIEISKSDDETKMKTLEVKSDLGDVNASRELTQMKSLKQVVKTEKPKSIIEHIKIVSGDIRKVFGSNTSGKGNQPKNLPTVFRISQNYPNPFNPTTKINYDLPKDSKVNIVIYDILGREVKRLVNNEIKQAGSYIVDFNALNYASGVYFYRIEAEEPNGNKFVDSKKMVLLK